MFGVKLRVVTLERLIQLKRAAGLEALADALRGLQPEQDLVPARLERGVNRILLCVNKPRTPGPSPCGSRIRPGSRSRSSSDAVKGQTGGPGGATSLRGKSRAPCIKRHACKVSAVER